MMFGDIRRHHIYAITTKLQRHGKHQYLKNVYLIKLLSVYTF